jgi:hypothetical protein
MQQIIGNKKKVIKGSSPNVKMPHSPLFSTEHLISKGFIKAEVIRDYFPDKPYQVDR